MKIIIVYECEYCGEVFYTKETCLFHEGGCYLNSKNIKNPIIWKLESDKSQKIRLERGHSRIATEGDPKVTERKE